MKSYLFSGRSFKLACLSFALFISPIAAETLQGGGEIYEINCQGCHMADGKGDKGAGVYPALANNVKLSSVSTTMEIVTNGLNGMPSFREYLTDEEILEVVNYIRVSFGNSFKDVAQLTDIPKN
ncbi:MAG: cytochrome c [Campylobacteraceae bacterium]|jgi:mono/diheme cytochrome c family protein|nr:cytochrome c [Campylobacteraceae bacterium]